MQLELLSRNWKRMIRRSDRKLDLKNTENWAVVEKLTWMQHYISCKVLWSGWKYHNHAHYYCQTAGCFIACLMWSSWISWLVRRFKSSKGRLNNWSKKQCVCVFVWNWNCNMFMVDRLILAGNYSYLCGCVRRLYSPCRLHSSAHMGLLSP